MKNNNIKNIYIVRHGETDWNKEGKIQGGEADIPLNETGKEQTKKLALYFKQYRLSKHNIDCIWTSPLLRAKETAEILKRNININSLKIHNELKETGIGKLSGLKKTDELRKLWIEFEKKSIETIPMIEFDEQTLDLMFDADDKLQIGIEKQELITQRCEKMIKEIKSSVCNNIIIVSHSGLISALLSQIYHIPQSIINTGGNCSLSYHQYDINNNKFTMISGQNNNYLDLIKISNNNITVGGLLEKIIIHITGTSGAGKTTLGEKLIQTFKNNIVVKDLDEFSSQFEKETGLSNDNENYEKKYQEYINKYIKKNNNKPIVFVGVNNNPWWNKKLYYNLHSTHCYFIDLDIDTIFIQRCQREIQQYFFGFNKDIMFDNIKNNPKKALSIMDFHINNSDGNCNYSGIKKLNDMWRKDYKKQNYIFETRENIYEKVKSIIENKLNGDEDMWNKIKIIKSLGRGNSGETFLIELNNKEYAMKRQKIVEEDLLNINYELDFYKWIEKLNNDDKNFFMNLYFYRKYGDCNFDFKPMRGELNEKYKTSKLCFDMIIDIKEGTVDKIIDTLTKEQIMSAFIQTVYAIYLMHKSGYYHFDTKTDNISYNKTTNKNVKIGKFGEINTYGYLFGVIDYGNIMHNKFELDVFDKKMLDSRKVINGDLSLLIDYILFNDIKLYSQIEKDKIGFKPKEVYDMIKLFPKEKYNNAIKFIDKKMKVPYITEFMTISIEEIKKEPNYRSLLYEIMQILQIKYPNSYHKIVENYFGMKLKKLDYFINKKDMLYIKKNQHKLKKIIKKFMTFVN